MDKENEQSDFREHPNTMWSEVSLFRAWSFIFYAFNQIGLQRNKSDSFMRVTRHNIN